MEKNQDLQFASDLRAAINKVVKKLRKESPTGQKLSHTERSVMIALYQHGALLPSELAAMEMITNQSMSQVLNNLQEFGLIVRIPSDTDKRKVNISLSETGVSTLIQFRHERDEWLLKAIMQTCTTEEKEILKQAIAPLNRLVDFEGNK